MGLCRMPTLRCAHLLNVAGIAAVYSGTFGLLLPVILHDWPYSAYYSHSRNDIDVVRKVVWVCAFYIAL